MVARRAGRTLPTHKTKIVCTIGPASETPEVIKKMILAGMNVARINFSHGDFKYHKQVIENLRSAAQAKGRRLAILADLSGPKIRIGALGVEPVELVTGGEFFLTVDNIPGDARRASVNFPLLPKRVKKGDTLFLNDGFIELKVIEVKEKGIRCAIVVGGELRSRKGVNFPGMDLGIRAFTRRDRECLEFALEQGVDCISQSFVECGEDIAEVREMARKLGKNPFIVAKIERAGALKRIDDILNAADGIMIARGDLGVEIPIEEIAVVQKQLTHRANMLGKPVITATQMLESMTGNRRPTRAEATDVANAILDGTDCVMLSEETAMGKYPVEAVAMLARIADAVEPSLKTRPVHEAMISKGRKEAVDFPDLIASSVETTFRHGSPSAVFVPTASGATARSIGRFRLPVWVIAVSTLETTCERLQFSYGVLPVCEPDLPEDWNPYVKQWLGDHRIKGDFAILTEGPSPKHPYANNRMEIIDLRRQA